MRVQRPIPVVSTARSKWWINVSSEGHGSREWHLHIKQFCTLVDVTSADQVSLWYALSLGYNKLMTDFATFEQRFNRLRISWGCKWTSDGLWCINLGRESFTVLFQAWFVHTLRLWYAVHQLFFLGLEMSTLYSSLDMVMQAVFTDVVFAESRQKRLLLTTTIAYLALYPDIYRELVE